MDALAEQVEDAARVLLSCMRNDSEAVMKFNNFVSSCIADKQPQKEQRSAGLRGKDLIKHNAECADSKTQIVPLSSFA